MKLAWGSDSDASLVVLLGSKLGDLQAYFKSGCTLLMLTAVSYDTKATQETHCGTSRDVLLPSAGWVKLPTMQVLLSAS